MHAMCRYALILSFFFIFNIVTAEEVVVVSASRFETRQREIGSSVTVISADDIEKSGKHTALDLLRTVPGLDLVRSGGAGGNTAIFLRGANSEHTLVLIDGIEANNPINTNRSFNIADLTLDNVERIEIVRGPQSTVYGSDALGGVINIISKKGGEASTSSLSVEAGSYRTFTEQASSSGSRAGVNYSLGVSRTDTDGISAASGKDGNSEDDAYDNTSASARVGFKAGDNLDTDFIVRYLNAHSDLDNFGGVGGDDPNRRLRNRQIFARAQIAGNFFNNTLTSVLGVSRTDQNIRDNNDPDADHPFDLLRSTYSGDLLSFDQKNSLVVDKHHTVIFGGEFQQETGSSDYRSLSAFGPFDSEFSERDAYTRAIFIEDRVNLFENLFVTLGGRTDNISSRGDRSTWRVAPAYLIESTATKIRGSAGTGFKAPSLFQLYSSYGRPDLNSEKSVGFDAGVDQPFLDERLTIGLTYFHNKFKELISFDPNTFIFENISRAKTAGIEIDLNYKISECVTLSSAYTYTDTEDEDSGDSLLRRARNKGSLEVRYEPREELSLFVNTQIIGAKFDNDFSTFPATRKKIGSYGLVNLGASYKVDKMREYFVRFDNVLDKEYEEVLGFGTFGATALMGVKVNL